MHCSLEDRTVRLSVGEFAGFSLGPKDSGGGPQGIWRAQLGQHWHNELKQRTLTAAPGAQFEIGIDGRLTHRGWTVALSGRIDQLAGDTLREIKSVSRPLPAGGNRPPHRLPGLFPPARHLPRPVSNFALVTWLKSLVTCAASRRTGLR